MDSKVKRWYDEWVAEKEEKKRKEEFKKRLKYGKPRGNTRPPFRMMTDDPGPS